LCVQERILNLPVVDRMAIEVARGERAQRLLESEPLAVPLAVPFGLDAVVASRFTFVTLDAASSTC
jgi:hypothetical protein